VLCVSLNLFGVHLFSELLHRDPEMAEDVRKTMGLGASEIVIY
jgi:hypothetical protein